MPGSPFDYDDIPVGEAGALPCEDIALLRDRYRVYNMPSLAKVFSRTHRTSLVTSLRDALSPSADYLNSAVALMSFFFDQVSGKDRKNGNEGDWQAAVNTAQKSLDARNAKKKVKEEDEAQRAASEEAESGNGSECCRSKDRGSSHEDNPSTDNSSRMIFKGKKLSTIYSESEGSGSIDEHSGKQHQGAQESSERYWLEPDRQTGDVETVEEPPNSDNRNSAISSSSSRQ